MRPYSINPVFPAGALRALVASPDSRDRAARALRDLDWAALPRALHMQQVRAAAHARAGTDLSDDMRQPRDAAAES